MTRTALALRSTLSLALAASLAGACGPRDDTSMRDAMRGDASADVGPTPMTARRLRGRIADDEGPLAEGLGGQDASRRVTRVEAIGVRENDYSAPVVAAAYLESDGTYVIDVPENYGDGALVLQSLDAEGHVVSRLAVERVPSLGSAAVVQPMSIESSLEAMLLIDLLSTGTRAHDVDLVSLRARIDARTAFVVRDTMLTNRVAAIASVRALARASLAAQSLERAALDAHRGNRAGFLTAGLALTASIDARLASGELSRAQADAELTAGYRALFEQHGLDASARARLEEDISSSTRLVVAIWQQSEALVIAHARASAEAQARASTSALEEAFARTSVDATLRARVAESNARLLTAVREATTIEALSTAFDRWRVELRGDGQSAGGVLAEMSRAHPIDRLALDATVVASVRLGGTLHRALDGALRASLAVSGDLDLEGLVARVRDVYAGFWTQLRASVNATLGISNSADIELVIALLGTTEGSFR